MKKEKNAGNSVYVLKDPKNNYRVSYVGISNDPWERYLSHMRAGNKSTNGTNWIMYVVKSGLEHKDEMDRVATLTGVSVEALESLML